MGPKKKEKNKKKEPPPPKTTKTQYIAQVAENNAILAQERKKTEAIEEIFFKSEKKYDEVQDDMADIVKYLQCQIEENEAEIAIFNEKIGVLNKELKQTDKYYESIFTKMESDFEEKSLELQHQIEQMKAKLFASEETRKQREEYLKKKEELEISIKEMEVRQEKEIYEAEKLAIIKQDTMQKSMESNLTSLVVDFRQASDFAIGETINTLVRNNIALGNMLTCMQETIEKARKSYLKASAEETDYKYNAELIEKEHDSILKRYDARIFNIEALIKSHEELYERIRSCQKLIKGKRRLLRQIAEEECLLREKNNQLRNLLRVLSEHEDLLYTVENKYNATRKEVVGLIFSLFETAKRVKEAVEIENLTRLEDDFATETENKEEQEENLIEYKFKIRETAIEDIINKLSSSIADTPLANPSTDSYLTKFQERISNV